jgi:hypothetical protein
MEVAMSTLLVGILLAGSVRSFAHLRGMQQDMVVMEQAHLLAHDLMQEILSFPYAEPESNPNAVSTGPDTGESSRSLFDDIDDYHGLTETPPVVRAGTPIPGASRFTRRVSVLFVRSDNPYMIAGSNQGMRIVSVFIDLDGQQVTSLFGIRSQTDSQLP